MRRDAPSVGRNTVFVDELQSNVGNNVASRRVNRIRVLPDEQQPFVGISKASGKNIPPEAVHPTTLM